MTTAPRILCVDDEPNVLDAFRRQLRGKFELEVCSSAQKALELIAAGERFAVVVSDMRMPEMDGITFLKKVQEASPSSVRIMLTGNLDQATTMQAINEGQIFRFLNKPCSSQQLELVIAAATEQYRLVTAEKELLQNTLSGSIKVLTDMLAISDPAAFGEASRMREPVRSLAKALKLDNIWELELAAMLKGIGWVAVPESVRLKYRAGAALSKDETELLSKVPETSYNLVSSIPRLQGVAKLILHAKGAPGMLGPQDPLADGAKLLRIVTDLIERESKGESRTDIFKDMLAKSSVHDAGILKRILLALQGADTESPSKFPVAAKDLCVGHRLMENLFCKDGRLLLGSGTYISEILLRSIMNYVAVQGLKEPVFVDSRIPVRGER